VRGNTDRGSLTKGGPKQEKEEVQGEFIGERSSLREKMRGRGRGVKCMLARGHWGRNSDKRGHSTRRTGREEAGKRKKKRNTD